MIQMLTLDEWAAEKYRSNPPAKCTLTRYAKAGHFQPPARKEGRFWRVREDAELVGQLTTPEVRTNDSPALQRILNDGC